MSLHLHLLVNFQNISPEPKVVRAVIQQALDDHYGPFRPDIEAHTITPIKGERA